MSAEQANTHRTAPPKLYLNAVAAERTYGASTCNREWRTDALGAMANHIKRATSFARPNYGTVSAHDDRRLLFGDRLNGVAKILLMI
jgi:hypothetical protein